MLDDGDAILFRIGRTFPDLAFDGFFTLVVEGFRSLQNDLPRAGGFGLCKNAPGTQSKHSVQSKADLHHAVHSATLHLRQNCFKKFLYLDPGDLHRSQFFDWKQ